MVNGCLTHLEYINIFNCCYQIKSDVSELSKSEDQRITKTKYEQIKQIDISDIKPNPYQPRKTFDEII